MEIFRTKVVRVTHRNGQQLIEEEIQEGDDLYLVVIGAGIVFASGLCKVPPNS